MQIATLILSGLACVFALAALLRSFRNGQDDALEKVRQDLLDELRTTRSELNNAQQQAAAQQDRHLQEGLQFLASQQNQFQQTQAEQAKQTNSRLHEMSVQTEQKLENIRGAMENRLTSLQRDNNAQLNQMRQTVDEKLQKTLDEKLHRSFGLVSSQLEQVHKGLGEMQSLAAGVGDLKKVLSGVKTRGILGEVQLGAILEQLLTKDQYSENIATVPGSTERVEFALRLPGDGETPVWMPIDAKFPVDAYSNLLDAYDTADSAIVEQAAKLLDTRVRGFAKDIHKKYISPPSTTDFGVMFLPIEGLYAEVVRRGIADRIQQEYRVIVAGPTTMSALLNSLQMGFRTLAIQQRSSEVWKVLGSVRAEFDTFGTALDAAQKRIAQAGSELENLVGVRTRQIQRKLKDVGEMPTGNAVAESTPTFSLPDSSAFSHPKS